MGAFGSGIVAIVERIENYANRRGPKRSPSVGSRIQRSTIKRSEKSPSPPL